MSLLVSGSVTASRYRSRLLQVWPRLVVALVSLYGIYYALNIIETTSHEIKTLAFGDPNQLVQMLPMTSDAIGFHNPVPSQLKFSMDNAQRHPEHRHNKSNKNDRPHKNRKEFDVSENNNGNDGVDENNEDGGRSIIKVPRTLSLFSQIRLVRNPEVDTDGQTEVAAIYTLLVISSLSIIDNAIGLMVATRRSLRLTQVAFAIWCLRFVFRMLSLVSVLFMLALSTEFRKRLPLSVELGDDIIEGSGTSTGSNGGVEFIRSSGSMITVTILEIIVALVHGWSLLVLIRDLRSQPRPRTMLSRVWTWFCGTRLGQRWDVTSYSYQGLDDGSISGNTHSAPFPPTSPYNGGSGTGNSGAGIYTSFTNMSSSSLSSLRLFNREVNEDEDDLESVWSTRSNLANAETMSIRSVRSVKSVRSISSTLSSIILGRTSSYAVPEMVSTTPSGRSRASSICSSEKS